MYVDVFHVLLFENFSRVSSISVGFMISMVTLW
jgi:hypothetical protein